MHTLGTAISAYQLAGGTGTPQKIVDQPQFSFQTQLGYPASNDVVPGDVIRTSCTWNNTTDQTVKFGENTSDEMCFAFIGYYPKINAPLFSWMSPSILGACTTH